jgi:putative PIN family toxin of toxin-antitoxin system
VKLVLDTNIVLDLWVFGEEAVASLRDYLASGKATWFGTPAMREELACVLRYEQIDARMAASNVAPQEVLAAFDRHTTLVDAPPPAMFKCRDPDDQKFVDLAVARGATLLSKDKALLALRRKIAVAKSFSAPLPG